jgi:hypothetical protein
MPSVRVEIEVGFGARALGKRPQRPKNSRLSGVELLRVYPNPPGGCAGARRFSIISELASCVFMVNPGEGSRRSFFERLKTAVWPPSLASVQHTENARLTQAKLFTEIARRVERPLDVLPSGDPVLVSVVLRQRAAVWAMAAAEDTLADGEAPTDSRAVFERIAGGGEAFAAVETLLRADVAAPDAASSAAAAAASTLASFTESLIDELDRPLREARRRRALHATLLIVAGGVAMLAALWVIWLTRPTNLVPSAKRTLSSQLHSCSSGECGNASFHTNRESSPWVQYDFGSPRRLHSVSVTNRTDCCYERAVPLVVETSNDGRRWKEQVRTDEPFLSWSSKLDGRARYLRLRAAKTTYLHLSTVVIR